MNEDEAKRLKRIIYILSAIVFIFTVGVTTWASVEFGRMKAIIAAIETPQVINGIDGKDAYTPQKNIDYFDGIDGSNGTNAISTQTIIEKPIYTNVPVPGPQGDMGIPGPQGDPGVTILIRTNPETRLEECKVLGDVAWQPIEDCE